MPDKVEYCICRYQFYKFDYIQIHPDVVGTDGVLKVKSESFQIHLFSPKHSWEFIGQVKQKVAFLVSQSVGGLQNPSLTKQP